MAIKANVLRDSRGNITVQMQGGLNYDHTINVRQELLRIYEDNPYSMINFDLSGMDFVGSSGIGHFVETLKMLNLRDQKKRMSISNIRPEFQKVFKLFGFEVVDAAFEAEWENDNFTEEMSGQAFAQRKRMFEN